jgi:drug/metabolite transporter (DMT)-like permease
VEVLLGGITSVLYGVGDFLGGQGAKRAPAASIVLWSGVLSFPLIALAALIVGGEPAAGDFGLGVLAGVAGSVGLVLLLAGLGRGHAAAVAPVAAAVGAVVPVLVAIFEGERPATLAWAGVAIAIPAILLCAWVVDPGDLPGGGLFYGLAAGVGFGLFTVLIRLTSEESNLFPLVASRGAAMATVIVLSLFGVWRLTGFGRVPQGIVFANAIFDVSANVTLLLALRAGSLALAAVTASFYPAVTVLMARTVNAEHLHVRQVAGLGLVVVSLVAIALG